jgi:hypothetical protein
VRHRLAALVALLLLPSIPAAVRPAVASCGAENCPLDQAARWDEASFNFDLSQQYIDQSQPRVGTEDAVVGQISSLENEVRTVNRVTIGRASYSWSPAWSASLSLPYVDRTHEHIHDPLGAVEYQRWRYHGIGDLETGIIHRMGPGAGMRTFLSAGVKAPTGVRNVEEVNGDQPEPPARPGTGSWDFMAGAGAEWHLHVGAFHERGGVPLRASVNGRWNGRGTDRYRVGSELTTHVAAEVPAFSWGTLLLQTNLRVHAKDDVGDSDAEAGNTGGTALYVSPGLRVGGGGTYLYGLVQIPVYQRVNGIQLVSDTNLYVGVTHSIVR